MSTVVVINIKLPIAHLFYIKAKDITFNLEILKVKIGMQNRIS